MPRRAEPGVAHVADHAQGPFQPHGQMSVRQVGRVLECEACGPFNVEFMRAFNRMWLAHRHLGWRAGRGGLHPLDAQLDGDAGRAGLLRQSDGRCA